MSADVNRVFVGVHNVQIGVERVSVVSTGYPRCP